MWYPYARCNGRRHIKVDIERLCLLIGNTRWHWAQYKSATWSFVHTPPDLTKIEEINCEIFHWAAVGKVPTHRALDNKNRILLRDIPIGNLPSFLGIDRALAAWGALRKVQAQSSNLDGVIIADAGTVLSLTKIDIHEGFSGGQLIPGLRIQLTSMAQNTESLEEPAIKELDKNIFPFNTAEAMRRGSVQSLLGALIEAQNEANLPLWLCGGDSSFLFNELRDRQIPMALYPNLVLEGMLDIQERITSGLDH